MLGGRAPPRRVLLRSTREPGWTSHVGCRLGACVEGAGARPIPRKGALQTRVQGGPEEASMCLVPGEGERPSFLRPKRQVTRLQSLCHGRDPCVQDCTPWMDADRLSP